MTTSSFRRWVCVVLLTATVAGCGVEENAGQNGASAQSPDARQVAQIGQPVATRYFHITVNGVSEEMFLDAPAGPGNKFIVLDVTMKNTDTESRLFSEGQLIAVHNGRELTFDKTETILADGFILFEDLNPLTTVHGKIVYKVPEELNGDIYWVPGRDSKRILLRAPAAPAAQDDAGPVSASAPSDVPEPERDADAESVSTGEPASIATPSAEALALSAGQYAASAEQILTVTSASKDQATISLTLGGAGKSTCSEGDTDCITLDGQATRDGRGFRFSGEGGDCVFVLTPSANRIAVSDVSDGCGKGMGTANQHLFAAIAGEYRERGRDGMPQARVSTTSTSPSFDCAKASTSVEKMICATPELAEADAALARSYATAKASGADAGQLKSEQRAFLAIRNRCSTVECVAEAYRARNKEL